MEAWKIRDNFPRSLDSPQCVDRSLDPINSLFCYNPAITANPYNAQFSQEPNNNLLDIRGPKIWTDAWSHEFVREKYQDCGLPTKDVKMIAATACNSPAQQSFPSPEEQLYANMSSEAGEVVNGESSKRKKIRKEEKGPIRVFKTRSDSNTVEDGYKWRKYGTKRLKSRPHPRSYYKCTESSCRMKKRVEREVTDPGVLITTYEGMHNHECPSVIYYIEKPIILPQQPGSKPAIVLVNAGVCSETVVKFASQ